GALPHPPSSRGARVLPAQGQRLRSLDRRDAAATSECLRPRRPSAVTASGQIPEGVDRERVESWFEASVPEVELPLSFERIAGGRSNLTYEVRDRAGRGFALRRPPLGKRLGSAHDVAREHRVMAALAPTDVPVPRMVGLC